MTHQHNHNDEHDNNHSQEEDDDYNHSKDNALTFAFWLNLAFSIVEVIGGVLTNSTAIIADAFHDLMDAVAIGLAILLEKISGKKRSAKFSYSYKRFSLLSALGLSVFLLAGSVTMMIAGYHSFFSEKEEISEIRKDFFTDNYPEPIYENGIQAKHMVMLTRQLK